KATGAPPATPEARSGPFFTGTSFIDGEGATLPFLPIEGLDGSTGAFRCGHGHESEAARLAGHFVLHQVGRRDRTMRRKQILEIVLGSIEGEVSNVQFCIHDDCEL